MNYYDPNSYDIDNMPEPMTPNSELTPVSGDARPGQPPNFGVLEAIVDEIIKHDEEHPDHGVGCACHDKHAGSIRRLLNDRMLNFHGRVKSLQNLLVVIGYVMRNP